MSMSRKAFRARVELLEARETPSAVHGLAIPMHHVVALRGTGIGVVTSVTPRPDGFALAGDVSGRYARVGGFTGQAAAVIGFDQHAHGSALLTDAAGDALALDFNGFVRPPGPAHRVAGRFRFTVTQGSGRLAGAIGGGQITGTLDTSTGMVRFNYAGLVRV